MIRLSAKVVHEKVSVIGKVVSITPHVVGSPEITYMTMIMEVNMKNTQLMTRLATAIEAGVALTNVAINTAAGGESFVTAKEEFTMRRLASDLDRLGF